MYTLIEHCEYGQLKDEMTRDRLVVGIRDSKLSEKLKLNTQLKLKEAINQARQKECVQKQQAIVRNELSSFSGETSSVDTVSNSKKPTVSKKHFQNAQPRKPFGGHNSKGASSPCHRCGYSHAHGRDECPARNQ